MGNNRLAESLHDREERLRKETLNIPGARSYFDERTNDPMSRDIYGDFFFACSPPVDPAPPSAAANPFGAVLKELRLHLLLDPVVAESQGLFNDGPSDMPPSWLGRDSLCMNLISKPNNGSRLQPGPVQVPTWWEPASKRGYIWAVVLGFGLLEIILWMSRFIAKRVFLIDLENSPEFATPPDVSNFDSIWDECSREEKLALCDFAVDGFLNSRNQSITSLLKRGLLRLYPLQLGDEAFRDPILSKCKDDETLAPAKEETLSWWQKTKWPLLVTLLGLTAFLFFTQRKVFEGGVGFLGAIAAAVTTFFNLFDQVRGGSTKK